MIVKGDGVFGLTADRAEIPSKVNNKEMDIAGFSRLGAGGVTVQGCVVVGPCVGGRVVRRLPAGAVGVSATT